MNLSNLFGKNQATVLDGLWKRSIIEPVYVVDFLKSLLIEELVILVDPNESKGVQIVEGEFEVRVFAFADGIIPVFTSTDRVFDNERIKHEVSIFEIKGKNLFEKLGRTFVLNPNSDQIKIFTPQEIRDLINGSYFQNRTAGKKIGISASVKIGRPSKYPATAAQALITLFKKRPDVVLGYVGWIHDPATDIPPHYIFAIKSNGDWEELCSEAMYLVGKSLGGNEVFDILQLTGTGGIENYFCKGTRPFYMKDV